MKHLLFTYYHAHLRTRKVVSIIKEEFFLKKIFIMMNNLIA